MLKSVEKAGLRGIRLKRDPTAIQPDDFFTTQALLKREFARLINAQDANRIAVVPSASYGISTVTRNVRIGRGEHILVAAEQFPSNYYPWQSLCDETGAEIRIVGPDHDFKDRGKRWNEKFLESITKSTRVVAIAHTHWADGTVFELEAIRKRTTETGTLLVIDGTQSVGALPFDVQKIKPDALVCAAYKWLLGPYSMGLAYYGEYFDDGKPIEHNWINRLGSENFSGLVTYEPAYQPGAARYSVGEQSNFILVPMTQKGIEQINRWGVGNIQEYCTSLSEPAINKLREHGFLIDELPYRASHLFGVRHVKGLDTEKLRVKLIKQKVHVSIRGTAIRVSPHVYNDTADLDRLVKVLVANI